MARNLDTGGKKVAPGCNRSILPPRTNAETLLTLRVVFNLALPVIER